MTRLASVGDAQHRDPLHWSDELERVLVRDGQEQTPLPSMRMEPAEHVFEELLSVSAISADEQAVLRLDLIGASQAPNVAVCWMRTTVALTCCGSDNLMVIMSRRVWLIQRFRWC